MTTPKKNIDKTEPFLIESEDCESNETSEGEDLGGSCRVRVRGRGGF